MFLVGAWNDVLEAAVDIRNAIEVYTEGALTISCGIGLYKPGYPIHVSAQEVAELEEDSKTRPGKNGITIFPDGQTHGEQGAENNTIVTVNDATYAWDIFLNKIIKEKYFALRRFFQNTEERGSSFLYRMLELIRGREDKLNLARYAYLLARMEPGEHAGREEKEAYREFSREMYQWIKDDEACRQLRTAIYLYVYHVCRDEDEEG